MTSFTVTPLPSQIAERARTTSHDEFGNHLFARVQTEDGAPCRHCLRRARAGEAVVLFSYSPFAIANPYKEVGPIFVHAGDCERYADEAALPEQMRDNIVLRGYDAGQEIARAEVITDGDAEAKLASLLEDPQIAFVHARSLTSGCYFYRIDRSS